jgi:hypothetical protein
MGGSDPSGPPHGVSLEAFAETSAAIAEGDRPLPEILGARGLSLDAWQVASAHYTRLLAFDAFGDGALADRFAARFVEAQDAIKPVPHLAVESWAEIIVDVGARGVDALRARGLSGPDYQRLGRHWARVLGHDRAAAKRYHKAFFAAAANPRIA